MRTSNRLFLAALFAGSLALPISAQSQSSAPYLAASPRLQKMLQERTAFARTSGPTPTVLAANPVTAQPGDSLAASPRVRKQLDENRWGPVPRSPEVASAGYQPTGKDGITASPKLRQQLDERSATVMIAPVR